MPTSLLSLLFALTVAGIIAATAAPGLSVVERERNAALLRQFEYLITLARELSASTDVVHGVRWDAAQRSFEVISADFTRSPPQVTGTPYDPVTRQPARLELPKHLQLAPDNPFVFTSLGAVGTLFFDSRGTPVNRVSGNHLQLLTGQLILQADNWRGELVVQPLSGRVTVN